MAHGDSVILHTPRLVLRPLIPADLDDVHSWAGNPSNTRYMSWGPNTFEETRAFLSSARVGFDFAVLLRGEDRVIGSCGIYPDKENDTGELGWILHMDHWQLGYGTELCGELIRYGFVDLKLRRICAPCAADNYGSYRVMERNGMRREALRVKAFWARVDMEWIDELEYAILAEEFFSEAVSVAGAGVGALDAEEEAPADTAVPPGLYQNNKVNQYEVLGFAKHSKSLEDVGVYKPLRSL